MNSNGESLDHSNCKISHKMCCEIYNNSCVLYHCKVKTKEERSIERRNPNRSARNNVSYASYYGQRKFRSESGSISNSSSPRSSVSSAAMTASFSSDESLDASFQSRRVRVLNFRVT